MNYTQTVMKPSMDLSTFSIMYTHQYVDIWPGAFLQATVTFR